MHIKNKIESFVESIYIDKEGPRSSQITMSLELITSDGPTVEVLFPIGIIRRIICYFS